MTPLICQICENTLLLTRNFSGLSHVIHVSITAQGHSNNFLFVKCKPGRPFYVTLLDRKFFNWQSSTYFKSFLANCSIHQYFEKILFDYKNLFKRYETKAKAKRLYHFIQPNWMVLNEMLKPLARIFNMVQNRQYWMDVKCKYQHLLSSTKQRLTSFDSFKYR